MFWQSLQDFFIPSNTNLILSLGKINKQSLFYLSILISVSLVKHTSSLSVDSTDMQIPGIACPENVDNQLSVSVDVYSTSLFRSKIYDMYIYVFVKSF